LDWEEAGVLFQHQWLFVSLKRNAKSVERNGLQGIFGIASLKVLGDDDGSVGGHE